MSHHGGFTKLKVPENLDKLEPSELTVDKMYPKVTTNPDLLIRLINAQYGIASEEKRKD